LLILCPNERRLYLVEDLQHNDVGLLFLEKNIKWPYDNLSNHTKTKILKYYKQGCYNTNDHKYKFLKKFVLSPSSYAIRYGKKEGFGCCKKCRDHVNTLKRPDNNSRDKEFYRQWTSY
jgi:hypothetical protein